MSENHPSIQLAVNGDDTGSLVKARRHLAESLAWLVVRRIEWISMIRRNQTTAVRRRSPPFRLMNKLPGQ